MLEGLEEHGAYLQPALEAAARRMGLSRLDRGLARELVGGVMRWRARLDHALEQHASRGLASTPRPIRRVLRLGAYQLMFLDRIPSRAAVHAAVEQARALGREPMAKLVNAVLRALDRKGERPPKGDNPSALAARLSHPRWLILRWIKAGGASLAARRAAANNRPAPLTIRPDRPGLSVEVLAKALEREGATITRAAYAPEALHIEGHPDPFGGDSFLSGWWRVQDEAAQLVGHLLDPRPGETVWDVCAAPGGKTRHLAWLMRDDGRLVASDTHPGKVQRLERALEGLRSTRAIQHDATVALEGAPPFDRVLVDAPCTGLGVLRRHPEIKWRRELADIHRLAELQRQILDTAAEGVRPGGVLVYSVCTDTPEEGPLQVAAFLERHPEFTLAAPPAGPLDWAPVLEDGCLVTRPEDHGCDGFFAARLERAAE